MKIYQLKVDGFDFGMGNCIKFYSKKIFYSKEEAEKHKDEFIEKCCRKESSHRLFDLDDEEPYEISIIELLLNDEMEQQREKGAEILDEIINDKKEILYDYRSLKKSIME